MAKCPAHRDDNPSLSVRQAHDRVLLHCYAGCEASAIVASLGLTLGDLYDATRHSRRNPMADRRRLAAQGLETWHELQLQRSAEELRLRDALSLAITRAVQAGAVAEAEAWEALAEAYDGYSELHWRFDRLLRNQDTLQLWRASRRGDA